MAGASKASEAGAAATVQVTVAPRRTVQVDDVTYGPNKTLSLERGEADRLRKLGFLLDPNADEQDLVVEQSLPTTEPDDDGPTLNGEDKSVIRPK